MIWPATPSGFGVPVRERVLELVGPAGVVEEVRGGERQVDVARLLDRLAAVQRLEHGELARALLRGCARSGTGTSRARSRASCSTSRCRTPRARRRPRRRRPRAVACATSASGSSVARRDRRVRARSARPTRRRRRGRSARWSVTMSRDSGAGAYVQSVGTGARSLRFARAQSIGEVVLRLVGAGPLLAELHQDVVERATTRRAGRGRASASRGRASRAPARGTGSPSSACRMPPAGFMPTLRPVSSWTSRIASSMHERAPAASPRPAACRSTS